MGDFSIDVRDWLNAKWCSLSNRKASLDYIRTGENLSGRAVRISFHDGEVVEVPIPDADHVTIIEAERILREYVEEAGCAK